MSAPRVVVERLPSGSHAVVLRRGRRWLGGVSLKPPWKSCLPSTRTRGEPDEHAWLTVFYPSRSGHSVKAVGLHGGGA